MSKLRSVNTYFWSDPFIEDLNPSEKLLFLYLITNEKTNMLGIYEASVKKMGFETGINKTDIQKILKGFEKGGKIKYINNYVILVNYMKHQNYNTNMKKSAIDIYNNLPNDMKDNELIISKDKPSEGFERLLNHYGMVPKVEVEVEVEYEVEDKYKKNNKIEKAKIFYNSESSENENAKYIKQYNQFIDILYGNNLTEKPLNKVLKIKNQVTYTQFKKLIDKKGDISIASIIVNMNNKQQYCNYDNMNLIIDNWINRNKK